MQYARITTNVLDMRAKPGYSPERINQALFDDLVIVSARRDGFVYVRKCDGYRGWVDERSVAPAAGSEQGRIGRVIAKQARLMPTPAGRTVYPHVLFYGTTVRLKGQASDGLARIVNPAGGQLLLRSSAIMMTKMRPPRNARVAAVIKEAIKFLGVPYLWGGITPCGCDCSGLVQTVFATIGVELPRDTKDQLTIGQQLEPDLIAAGDLLFFERHVAIAIDRYRFIHSSRASGVVTIESLLPKHAAYRPDLHAGFAAARRVI
ncbi:MAG: NlpC/P60 family protein [bacterium]